MTEIKASNPRILFNGVDLTRYLDGDTLTAAVNTALADVITSEVTVGIGRAIALAIEDMCFTFVGVRPAVRKSCLWRHSFNWRNRKRGHVLHRPQP